tara:strand:+ start:41189 stop:41554 length:366 start_codon:yes stop_codon:yes gene_type:complete
MATSKLFSTNDVRGHPKSFLFILKEDHLYPLSNDDYVAVSRGTKTLPKFSGENVKLLDLYVEMINDEPRKIIKQTCTWISFDPQGKFVVIPVLDLPKASPLASTSQIDLVKNILFEKTKTR